MARGEIAVDGMLCKGCKLCTAFCNRGCIVFEGRLGPAGNQIAEFVNPEKCTACGICGWLCPDYAIMVYEYVS